MTSSRFGFCWWPLVHDVLLVAWRSVVTPVVWASLQLMSSRNSMRPLKVVLGFWCREGCVWKRWSVFSEKNGCFNDRYNRITFRWATVDGQNFYGWDGYSYGDVTQEIAFFLASYCFLSSHLAWWFPREKQGVFRSSLLGWIWGLSIPIPKSHSVWLWMMSRCRAHAKVKIFHTKNPPATHMTCNAHEKKEIPNSETAFFRCF